jgi:hypothetical protein
MENREAIINDIKEWIKIDNEINLLRKEMKDRTNKKKSLTNNLVNTMKTNNIDCFDIKNGSLVYKKNKIKKPITGKSLLSVLKNYYKKDDIAEELTKYIMDNREEVIKDIIKMNYIV